MFVINTHLVYRVRIIRLDTYAPGVPNSLVQWNTQCGRGKQQNGYRQEHCSKLKGIKPLVSAGEIHGCWLSFKHLEAEGGG